MTRLYRHIIAAVAVSAVSLTGCVNEDGPCPPDEPGSDDGKEVTLRFTVATRSAAVTDDAPSSAPSRADDCEGDRQGTAAENFINMSDCRFLLFDADRKLIRPIFPEFTAEETAEYTLYSVKATIVDPYFEKAVKEAGDGGKVKFYIMVIANTRSEGLNGQDFAYFPGATTISEMAGQRKTFDLPPRRGVDNSLVTWNPSTDVAVGRFIPMAGLQEFNVAAASLKAATEDAPLDLPDPIDMLRSMAKIEVIDKIDMPDGYKPDQKRMKVKNVELAGFNTKGTIMPSVGTGGQWPAFCTAQVAGVTLPSQPTACYSKPAAYGSADASRNDMLRFFEDESASTTYHEGYPVYSGYVAEYDRESVAGYVKPYIVVTLVDSDEGGGVMLYRELKLDKYIDGSPAGDGIEALLRNHIYRYEITGVATDVSLTVNYTVCNMDTGEADIEFN